MDINSHSLVLEVKYREFHMLLTGDMGSTEEAALLAISEQYEHLPCIQVLKVAHHGSRNSSSGAWLSRLAPRWAVVSYGSGNSYGHPHEEVTERLQEQGVRLYHTAKNGAVRLDTDGARIRFKTWIKSAVE